MPSWRKATIVSDLNNTVKAFARSGLEQRHPDAARNKSAECSQTLYLAQNLPKRYTTVPDETVEITLLVTDVMEKMDIRYAVGGSLSSSMDGVKRLTLDDMEPLLHKFVGFGNSETAIPSK